MSRRGLSTGTARLKADEASPSSIPGMDTETRLGVDSYTTRESFKAFHQSGKYIGAHEGYGANIKDKDRLFYSTREPVGVWWIKRIAYDT